MPKVNEKKIAQICFNPFNGPLHSVRINDLRPFSQSQLRNFPHANEYCVLCSNCRKKVNSYCPPDVEEIQKLSQEFSSLSVSTSKSSMSDFVEEHSVEKLLKVSPIQRKLLNRKSYVTKKSSQIHSAVSRKMKTEFGIVSETTSEKDLTSILDKLKILYESETNKEYQMKYLTLLPESWSCQKIKEEFNCTIRQMDKLREIRNAVVPEPSKIRPGKKPINDDLRDKIIDFYEDQRNVKEMPGVKDVKSVKNADGSRRIKQKKILLYNLRELHAHFRELNPNLKIGFSKFAMMKPDHCIFAGPSSTHTVCVCTLHQNWKLMLEGCELPLLVKDRDWLDTKAIHKSFLREFICAEAKPSCYDRTCQNCPKAAEVANRLNQLFIEHEIEKINYKRWTTSNHCSIENVSKTTDSSLDCLLKQMEKLLKARP